MTLTTDDPRHGSRRGYDLGCRCLRCAVAESRYQAEWSRTGPTRVPAADVKAHLRELVRSGWTKLAITEAAGLGSSTVWHIENRQSTVNRGTAARIFELAPLRRVRLPVEPLELFLRRPGIDVREAIGDESLRRAWYRATASGRIADVHADRICVEVLGLTLDEVYGPGWDDEEVAA